MPESHAQKMTGVRALATRLFQSAPRAEIESIDASNRDHPYPERSPGRTPPTQLPPLSPAPIAPPIDDFQLDAQARRDEAMRQLIDHSKRMLEQHEQLRTAQQPVDRLLQVQQEARARLDQITADIAALDAEERRALEKWVDEPQQPRLAPRTSERQHLRAEHDEAVHDLAHIDESLREKTAILATSQTTASALKVELDALIVNCLIEEAEIVGHSYLAALERVAQLAGELLGINGALLSFSNVTLHGDRGPSPAQIFSRTINLNDLEVRAKGFRLRSHRYSNFVTATPTMQTVYAAEKRWTEYVITLKGHTRESDEEVRDRTRLLEENAVLKAEIHKNKSEGAQA